MPIGSKLQKLFTEKNTNVNEVAVATGISPNTLYSLIRRDSEKASIDDLYKVAHFLGVSLNYFTEQSGFQDTEYIDPVIKKYRALDEHGKDIIDYILTKEYERCAANELHSEIKKCRIIPLSLQPASAGTGTWLDDDLTEELEIPNTPEYKYADFAVRVSGDSMEPTFSDGDVVMVHEQDAINIGDIGLFTMDGSGYIKELGKDTLISHNKDYLPIALNESVKCYGKVIGKK